MIRNLSYVGFTSPAAASWRTFGPEILGAELVTDPVGGSGVGADDVVRLRVDDAPWRIAVHPGTTDALAYLGWDVGDDLEPAVAHLEAAGVAVERKVPAPGTRPADVTATFTDPFGFRHELSTTLPAAAPFTAGRPMGPFVTGARGLGHVVLIVPDLEVALGFATDVLGFRLSDAIESGLSLRFLHCAGSDVRHHTLAFAEVPGMVGLHHLMLEVADPDDVGRAYDLVRTRDLPLAMDLGRHTNDLMTSFYVRTPSGFEIEYGSGGVTVDDATWRTTTYDSQSIWGHHPPTTGMLLPGILTPFAPRGGPA